MSQLDMLGKIVVALTAMPQYLGLVLDVIEKMTKPEFARELAKFARREVCWERIAVLNIVRNLFTPSKFVKIAYTSEVRIDETDPRSVLLTQVDLTKVKLVSMLKEGETSLKGEERLSRLKESNLIRLDADIFFMLWENQHLIPEGWKKKIEGNRCYIFFDGSILITEGKSRCVLYMSFISSNEWVWGVTWLHNDFDGDYLSAVLEN